MTAIITLLTDFGIRDSYVGQVKGRLLSLLPEAVLVDIAHDIAPGDVPAAAYVLARTWRAFPPGTTHLAVVDPGVGTARRALEAEGGGHRFVVPDNGLLTFVGQQVTLSARDLAVPPGAAPTFHGRDLFAPAAAELARGELLTGGLKRDPLVLDLPPWTVGPDETGTVLHVDHFGVLMSNITWESGRVGEWEVRIAGRRIPLRTTFGDVASGRLVAYVGSAGTIEVAVRDGRADKVLRVKRGAAVRLSSARSRPRRRARR